MTRQDIGRGYLHGTLASIVAAILIAWLLYEVYNAGFQVLFQGASLVAMITLLVIGIFAGISYRSLEMELGEKITRYAPLVISLAGVGIIAGVLGYPLIGGGLIVVSYFIEPTIGLPLYRFSIRYDKIGAQLFLGGVLFYTVTLPFIVLDNRIALLPLVGDIVKLIGLLILGLKAVNKY